MERTLFTDDHEMFRESVRAFVAKEITPHTEALIDGLADAAATWGPG